MDGETLIVAQGDYTYDETTGIFATLPGRVTVPAATYAQAEDGTWVYDSPAPPSSPSPALSDLLPCRLAQPGKVGKAV